MSVFDERSLEAEAARGTALAMSALHTTLESKGIALRTAETLQNQNRQLQGIRDTVEETGSALDGIDRTVDKLTKGKIRRVAEAPVLRLVGDAKGRRQRKRVGNKETGKGVAKEGWKSGNTERVGHRLGRRFGQERVVRESVKPIVEPDEYTEFTNTGVREQLKRQDRVLDETSVQLHELKSLALGIEDEIQTEAEIIDRIDAPTVTNRIRANHRKLLRGLKL